MHKSARLTSNIYTATILIHQQVIHIVWYQIIYGKLLPDAYYKCPEKFRCAVDNSGRSYKCFLVFTYWSATGCVLQTWVLQEAAGPGRWLRPRTGKWRSRGRSPRGQGWGSVEACMGEWREGFRWGERGNVGGSGRAWCWSRQEGRWINQVWVAGWKGARAGDAVWTFCRHRPSPLQFRHSGEEEWF